MVAVHSTYSGLSGYTPHTPPSTPHSAKRHFERSTSPESPKSIHPTETVSPEKKSVKQDDAANTIRVEELAEGDPGYHADVDVVYPEELEEIESTTSDEESTSDGEGSETGITQPLSRLRFEQKLREKHRRKRADLRASKRSHTQTVKSDDSEVSDPDAMADHDNISSARRLRRRVRGPDSKGALLDYFRSSSTEAANPATPARSSPPGIAINTEAMEVDGSK